MAAEFSTGLNGPPCISGKTLLLLCDYGPQPRTTAESPNSRRGRIWKALTLADLRHFIAERRDWFSNPKDSEYMLALAKTVLDRYRPAEVHLRTIGFAPKKAPGKPDWTSDFANLSRDDAPTASGYDTVILAYPDPLGLGWERLESRLLGSGPAPAVLNGRRRLFTLDGPARRSLRWRRLLTRTRFIELILLLLFVPLAAGLALKDRLSGRS